MVSISQAVRELIQEKPIIYESLSHGIVSYANLAEHLHKQVELELGKKVELPAVVMAIRRFAETISLPETSAERVPVQINSEIIMKTGLADICIVKTPSAMNKLKRIYEIIDNEKGETLNVIQGNYEITIVINDKYVDAVKKVFKDEKFINIERDVVSIILSFSEEFFYTPGSLAMITRKLAWENINIYENISTMTELIYIVGKKDAVRAYKALQTFTEKK